MDGWIMKFDPDLKTLSGFDYAYIVNKDTNWGALTFKKSSTPVIS